MVDRRWSVGLVALLSACGTPASEGDADTDASETVAQTETEAESPETETAETETETGGEDLRPARLAVTADWRAKRLSLLDYAALRDGAETREAALWKEIPLPEHEPGPLEVELTPDGSLAIVAVGPGFFAGAGGVIVGVDEVPIGGALLVVDVETGAVLEELMTAQYPMGIVIAPDGASAWTANYGGNGQSGTTVSHIDLGSFTITEELEVGPGPEQIDLTADGSLALVNLAGSGSIRVFETAAASATISDPLVVSDDPSGVLFLDDGMDRAVAINSAGPPGYSLLDLGDPAAPAVLDTIAVAGIAYAVAPGRTANEILLSVYTGLAISLQMFDVDTGEVVDMIDVPITGFPLGIVFDPIDEIALVPVPGHDALIVAEFATGTARVIDWQDQPGPTYVTLE